MNANQTGMIALFPPRIAPWWAIALLSERFAPDVDTMMEHIPNFADFAKGLGEEKWIEWYRWPDGTIAVMIVSQGQAVKSEQIIAAYEQARAKREAAYLNAAPALGVA